MQIETRYVAGEDGGTFETQACQDGQLLELDRYGGRDAALEGHQRMVDRYRQATRTSCANCHRAWWTPDGLRCPDCGSDLSRG